MPAGGFGRYSLLKSFTWSVFFTVTRFQQWVVCCHCTLHLPHIAMQWPLKQYVLDTEQVKCINSAGNVGLLRVAHLHFGCTTCSYGLRYTIVHMSVSISELSPLLGWCSECGEVIKKTDSMFASYFSEALLSTLIYLSVPSGPITDQPQHRADVWNIVCHYVCMLVIIYDVRDVIRINLWVCVYVTQIIAGAVEPWMVQDVFQLASGGSLLSCTSGTKK